MMFLVANSFWEMGSQFPLREKSLQVNQTPVQSQSSGSDWGAQFGVDSIKNLLKLKQSIEKLEVRKGVDLGTAEGAGEYDQNIIYEILKSLKKMRKIT